MCLCVCVFFVKFMCHSNSIENYSDYLVFELNSNTSYLGCYIMAGLRSATQTHKGPSTTKKGSCIWHWCNTKTTCIQIHKQMIFCCFNISNKMLTFPFSLVLLFFFEISFFCWKKIIYCFFIDILFHLAFFFAWWHTVKKRAGLTRALYVLQ